MPGPHAAFGLIEDHYRHAFGAAILPTYRHYRAVGAPSAALGYTRAGDWAGQLFLERYLDASAEIVAAAHLGRPVARAGIVEIGHFVSRTPIAMIDLWGDVARALAPAAEIAMATLTKPLREAMVRVGVPFTVLAPATADRAGDTGQDWGRYYDFDPMVCMGSIAEGLAAITRLQGRRPARRAA